MAMLSSPHAHYQFLQPKPRSSWFRRCACDVGGRLDRFVEDNGVCSLRSAIPDTACATNSSTSTSIRRGVSRCVASDGSTIDDRGSTSATAEPDLWTPSRVFFCSRCGAPTRQLVPEGAEPPESCGGVSSGDGVMTSVGYWEYSNALRHHESREMRTVGLQKQRPLSRHGFSCQSQSATPEEASTLDAPILAFRPLRRAASQPGVAHGVFLPLF